MMKPEIKLIISTADSIGVNRELKQTDAAAERRRSTSNFLFRRTQGQVNILGPWHHSLYNWKEIWMWPPPLSSCVSLLKLSNVFKLSQLSYCVCCCYGISVHENNYDTSSREKRFHTIWWQNTLQIFAVIAVELAKTQDCDFSCIKLALQKVSVSREYKSSKEISAILSELVC